jgi:hypothetical protein
MKHAESRVRRNSHEEAGWCKHGVWQGRTSESTGMAPGCYNRKLSMAFRTEEAIIFIKSICGFWHLHDGSEVRGKKNKTLLQI